jgi:2-hydroxy-3-oxopropionate reductase
MATVGFVGLGIMGRPMLINLLKAGHTVIAFGRNAKKLDACVADGAVRAASNRDVGMRASIIFTKLPDGPEVEEVVLGFRKKLRRPAPPKASISWMLR